MKKLDDIPKKDIFEIPDGYFDQLALKIQARTEKLSPTEGMKWGYALRYAIPVVLITICLIFLFKPKAIQDTEELLAAIPTEHLIAYLHESDISEQDLIEAINFGKEDIDSLNLHLHSQFLLEGLNEDEFKTALENEL